MNGGLTALGFPQKRSAPPFEPTSFAIYTNRSIQGNMTGGPRFQPNHLSTNGYTAPKTRQAFCPPNPKLLDNATLTCVVRASLGT